LISEILNIKTFEEFSGWDIKSGKPIFSKNRVKKRFVKNFYKHYRCAVAHGGGGRNKNNKVFYPILLDFNPKLWWDLEQMIEIANELLKRNFKLY